MGGRFFLILAGSVVFLSLWAWQLPNIFAWTFTFVYFAGIAWTIFWMAFAFVRLIRDNPVGLKFRMVWELVGRVYDRKLGPLGLPTRLMSELLAVLNWPMLNFSMAYLKGLQKRAPSLTDGFFAGALVPAWLQPSVFIFIALALLRLASGGADDYPLRLVAFCYVAATVMNLLLTVAWGGAKDQALARVGEPRWTFVVILVTTLGSAVFSRMFISGWSGMDAARFTDSAQAIINLSDVHGITQPLQLTVAGVMADPGRLARLSTISFGQWLLAAINVLFYLGFASIALKFFLARREPKHHLTLGSAYAALGIWEKAEHHLHEARELKHAQLLLSGVRLRGRNYKGLKTIAAKLSANTGATYSREEEALAAALCCVSAMPTDASMLIDYFRHSSPEITDPDYPGLIVTLMLPLLPNPEQMLRDLRTGGLLTGRPLFDVYFTALDEDVTEARAALIACVPETLCGRLLQLWLAALLIFQEQPGAPTVDEVAALVDPLVESLQQRQEDLTAEWQVIVAHDSLARTQALLLARGEAPRPGLVALATLLEEQVKNSELVGESVKLLGAFTKRENDAFASRLGKQAPAL